MGLLFYIKENSKDDLDDNFKANFKNNINGNFRIILRDILELHEKTLSTVLSRTLITTSRIT